MTSNCEPADETNKEDPTQGIPVFLQPFTANPVDLETYVLAHYSKKKKTLIRTVMLQKKRHKNGSTVFMVTSAKTKRDLFREQKVW